MSNEEQSKATDSEEDKAAENERLGVQIDKWLEIYLDDMFSNLMHDDLTEPDESKEQLGECNITRDGIGKKAE